MNDTNRFDGRSLALLTDLYELTMACGYWKTRMTDVEAVFALTFRENPFDGGFTIACGLGSAIEYLGNFRFETDDLDYLATLTGSDGDPLFPDEFLRYLGDMELSCDIDAIPEGTVIFPHEPVLRVSGPIIHCQILESALLNLINFQTLIATKAARVVLAARGDRVIEFGLRRAQGINGGLAATRASYIGGCESTSNVLAGKLLGIPVSGTQAHSWIMAFESEKKAFEAWADAMPNNAIFLVDTYDSLDGVRNATVVGKRLRERGYDLAGIRLDSGDLAWLSIEARKILDEEGFPNAEIAASNEFDEHIIASLKEQGARITIWGIGTRLVTAYDQPALGGVYKLTAVRRQGAEWQPRLKLSEQAVKVSNPGVLQVRRYHAEGQATADMIWDEMHAPEGDVIIVDPLDHTRTKTIPESTPHEDLLVPVFRKGSLVYESPTLAETRAHARRELESFHGGIKRFVNPHRYPVGLERRLASLKTKLVVEARHGKRG